MNKITKQVVGGDYFENFIPISISNLEIKLMNINRYGEAGVTFSEKSGFAVR